jgi:hypothetical protein
MQGSLLFVVPRSAQCPLITPPAFVKYSNIVIVGLVIGRSRLRSCALALFPDPFQVLSLENYVCVPVPYSVTVWRGRTEVFLLPVSVPVPGSTR